MLDKSKLFDDSNFEILPVNILKTAEYQKNRLDVARAKAIGKDFDLRKAGAIIISKRGKSFYIVDGQHRTAGAKISEVSHIMCQVLYGLTYEEEAMLFAEQDRNKRPLNSGDKFRAKIEGQDAKSLEIIDVLAKLNLEVRQGRGDFKIQAIGTVEKIMDKLGADGLERCLKLIKGAWNGEEGSFQSGVLKGVTELITRYQYDLEDEVFIKQLKKIEISDIVREARSATYHYDTLKVSFAKVMFKYYNRKLRSNRLEWINN